MKNALIFALAIVSTAAAVSAHAQSYQWRDSSGRLVISDRPPPAGVRDARPLNPAPPAASSATESTAPRTTAEQNMEFRKRQQEARETADKQVKDAAAAAQKREVCERARNQLATLESGNHRLVVPDGKGGEVFVEGEVKETEMERTRKMIAESCN
ncbi:MAG: DUF4124 domain-containing protein [Sulfuritalea sp.]|nr:DUF4124 domain-containing protein [Sulfuritalea sp.]